MVLYFIMWFYQGSPFTSDDIGPYLGFVYLITCLTTNRKYIGQKKFHSFKRVQKDKKKKRVKIESNWQDYWSSSLALQQDVYTLGQTKFKREIIHLCKSKGWMNFLELKEQVLHDVLLSPDYYNDYIGSRIHRKHLTKDQK